MWNKTRDQQLWRSKYRSYCMRAHRKRKIPVISSIDKIRFNGECELATPSDALIHTPVLEHTAKKRTELNLWDSIDGAIYSLLGTKSLRGPIFGSRFDLWFSQDWSLIRFWSSL
jgi:hypothetical protein